MRQLLQLHLLHQTRESKQQAESGDPKDHAKSRRKASWIEACDAAQIGIGAQNHAKSKRKIQDTQTRRSKQD